MSNKFEFYSGLRGYHVYHNTVNWKPYVKEKTALKREHNNEHGKFAVAGRVAMRGRFWLDCCWTHTKRTFSLCVVLNSGRGEV